MKTQIAIQTSVGGNRFVTNKTEFPLEGCYRYTSHIETAVLFPSVSGAVRWIERVAFRSGSAGGTYSGAPRLVRVNTEEVETTTVRRYYSVGELVE